MFFKDIVKRRGGQATDWRLIFVNPASVSGIYKDLPKLSNKETNIPCKIARVVEQKIIIPALELIIISTCV